MPVIQIDFKTHWTIVILALSHLLFRSHVPLMSVEMVTITPISKVIMRLKRIGSILYIIILSPLVYLCPTGINCRAYSLFLYLLFPEIFAEVQFLYGKTV